MHVLCITNQMNTTQIKHLWNSQSKDRDTHSYIQDTPDGHEFVRRQETTRGTTGRKRRSNLTPLPHYRHHNQYRHHHHH